MEVIIERPLNLMIFLFILQGFTIFSWIGTDGNLCLEFQNPLRILTISLLK